MAVDLKSVTALVFFSSDVANTDTYTKFYCDLQMYNTTMPWPDPEPFMNQFVSWEIASKENKWQGRNITRWRSDDYDQAFRAAETELDPVKRAALFIRMNDLVCENEVVIPMVNRPKCRRSPKRCARRSPAGTMTWRTSGIGSAKRECGARRRTGCLWSSSRLVDEEWAAI